MIIWQKYHNTSRNRDFSYPDRILVGIFKQNWDNPNKIRMVGQSEKTHVNVESVNKGIRNEFVYKTVVKSGLEKWCSQFNWKGKKWGSITCCTNQVNKTNEMFIIWHYWLFLKRKQITWHIDRWSRAWGLYSSLRTWNWPITACEMSQLCKYIKWIYCIYPYSHNNT